MTTGGAWRSPGCKLPKGSRREINCRHNSVAHTTGKTVKGKADDLYRGSMQFENHRRTALQYPLVHWTRCRCQQYGTFSMKSLARYQVILLGEQRHIRCEQLAQGCCPNNGIMPRSESNPRPLDHESNALPLHYRGTPRSVSLIGLLLHLNVNLEAV